MCSRHGWVGLAASGRGIQWRQGLVEGSLYSPRGSSSSGEQPQAAPTAELNHRLRAISARSGCTRPASWPGRCAIAETATVAAGLTSPWPCHMGSRICTAQASGVHILPSPYANVAQHAVTRKHMQQSQTTACACSPAPVTLPSTPVCLRPTRPVHISSGTLPSSAASL